ncbi:hypothetical protein [Streptomyces sp. AK08-02]|uniref:hypothetical protein n=1 Tax=Streptomyces sp. AK08-02 TaxID=3028654 RepID=UPI0029B25414|nr:hypothetical protein [Streptomyces sp. AK08-02]MDX3748832.1 hypothetical protein [Streptomyces sp. AK08-02]
MASSAEGPLPRLRRDLHPSAAKSCADTAPDGVSARVLDVVVTIAEASGGPLAPLFAGRASDDGGGSCRW